MSDQLFPITLQEEIAEVEREITMRERNYARWVANGQLKKDAADRQLSRMRAVASRLHAHEELERRIKQAALQLEDGLHGDALATLRGGG